MSSIVVKRLCDGKIFTSDMTAKDTILEMHFSTSYTQVEVQEEGEDGRFISGSIIVYNKDSNPLDLLAITDNDKEGVIGWEAS